MKSFNIVVAVVSLLVDLTMIILGLVIAYQLRSGGYELFQWPLTSYLRFSSLMLPVWVIFFANQGLYDIRNAPRGWNAIAKVLIGLMGGWAVMIIALYLWRTPESFVLPRLLIIYGFFLTALTVLIGRLVVQGVIRWLYRHNTGVIRTLVIINGGESDLVNELKYHRGHGRRVVGVVNSADVLDRLGQYSRVDLDEVIVDSKDLSEDKKLSILNWAEANGIGFALVPSLLSVRSTNVDTSALAGTPVMFFRRTPLEGWGRVYKRILDLIVVLPLTILIAPIYGLLAILVKLSSPGPIVYRELRVGQDGREFRVGKFRSMYADWRSRFTEVKDWSADETTDIRITSLGRIIRKTNLDELPQLWDVVKGKMSLVGPRPEQPKYVEQFSREFPNYFRRHHVKSGLTGWAQINGARGNTPIAERVKYDLYYIENWSIWFDIRIILATVVFLFRQLAGGKN